MAKYRRRQAALAIRRLTKTRGEVRCNQDPATASFSRYRPQMIAPDGSDA
jgi:hypothetical protein